MDIQEVSERVVERHMHDPELVEICHIPPGNPDNAHTIWVEESDVPAHISAHGDHEGACALAESHLRRFPDQMGAC